MAAAPPTRRRRFQFGIGALVAAMAITAVVVGIGRWPNQPIAVRNNELVGRAEGSITAEFGKPVEDHKGYEPLRIEPRAIPAGNIRTLIYRDNNGGTLWVWLRDDGHQWTCVESCWFADGVRF
jgi:hypothetical protein